VQPKKVIIIGAGFSGLSAATFMAKAGWQVTIIEKHAIAGGRAKQLMEEGFVFDMGPSWYWMPDIFERYFNQFGKKVSDYYTLKRLDPSYSIYWQDGKTDIPADYNALKKLFNSIEEGSAEKLDAFLNEAAYKYEVGINKLVFKPGQSLAEFLDADLFKGIFKLDVFSSVKSHVAKYFKSKKIQQILEFPVLFLGALAEKIPALYSLMNYADIKGGTWYPEGGMYKIVEAMHQLAIALNVEFHFNENVEGFNFSGNNIQSVITNNKGKKEVHSAEVIISGADYHHIEHLLPKHFQSYSEKYWDTRTMAPSCLLYYVGLNKKLNNIQHHSLFFDTSFEVHGKEMYEARQWPTNPLFYVCAASVSDNTIAPKGYENLFFLIPVATGLQNDTDELREHYFKAMVERMEKLTKQSIQPYIVYKKSFAVSDFISEYNSFKGNAYGLANTLMQTSILKPSCKSKKINNLFYTGQLTVPGPGVPPSLISGEVVAKQVQKDFADKNV
jgi:phytoene desaturase